MSSRAESKRAVTKTPGEPSQVVLYQAAAGKVTVNVLFARDNVWLTQKTMADLFGVNIPAVNKHLKNIFASGELEEASVISILETTAADGKVYPTRFYEEFEKHRVKQDRAYVSDFDQAFARYLKGKSE